MKNIHEPARQTPVIGEVDVLVCGGGPSGIMAAMAAAKNGSKTFLVEQEGFLGGSATANLINPLPEVMSKGGFIETFLDQMAEQGGYIKHDPSKVAYDFSIANAFDPEIYKFVAHEMLHKAGVKLLLHTIAVQPVMEDNIIKGAIIENKSGRQAIMAKRVVDATGDGDIAARAGAPFKKGRDQDEKMQTVSLLFQLDGDWDISALPTMQFGGIYLLGPLLKEIAEKENMNYDVPYQVGFIVPLPFGKLNIFINLAHVEGIDGTKAEDLTRAHLELRPQIISAINVLKKHPYFANAHLTKTGTHIYIRETRRILGEYMLNEQDVVQGKKFDDAVTECRYMIDIHPIDDPTVHRYEPHPPYDIPYRSLVPLKVENLLVSGRCISCDQVAQSSLRIMGTCMSTGEAAGTAAALSVKHEVAPRKLDYRLVREVLEKQGVNIRRDDSQVPANCMF